MAATILKAVTRGGDTLVRVHLDTTKLDAEGAPLPEWVREWTWGPLPASLDTNPKRIAAIKDMLKENVREELRLLKDTQPSETPIAALEGQAV